MATNAMISRSDSQNPSASWDATERPPLVVSAMGQGYLDEELETARFQWLNAVRKIPVRAGVRNQAALKRAKALQERYEALLGHPAGKPDQKLPMDDLPHRDIKGY